MYSSSIEIRTGNISANPPSLDTTYLGEENIPNDWKEGYIIKIPIKETSVCVKTTGV